MEVTRESMIIDHRSFLKKTSLINDGPACRRGQVQRTDAMADKAMRMLQIPEIYRKSVLWLAWHRSEARFWEMVEAAMSDKVREHGRYFISSITRERCIKS